MYHPTGRVLTVLEWLQSRSAVTGPELAERLEIDVRSVRRYIQKLQDVGIPIESMAGRYGGYQIRPGFRLPPLIFSEDEVLAVMLGLLGSSWLQLSLPRDAVESTLSKISRVLPTTTWDRVQSLSQVSIVSFDPGSSRVSPTTLLHMSRAVADQVCVRLGYQAQESTTRVVEPYGVAGFQGHWYMAAFCRLRQATRLFRLDRIQSFELLAERFEKPRDFTMDQHFKDGFAAQRWKVRLWFDATPEAIAGLMGTLGEVSPAGSGYEYRGPSDDLEFVARILLFSGLPCKVLEPEELKQAFSRIAETARGLAE